MSHTSFTSISRRLDRGSVPMRLFEKAKRLGIWNPSEISLEQDARDWPTLAEDERDLVLRLLALFQAGEEAVTIDLLPLIGAIAADGRLEEELFLTSFLWEEAKHTDLFSRVLADVMQETGDLSRFHTDNFRALIYDALPAAMQRLRHDTSPDALAHASLTYNMIVEGVLAETGYHTLEQTLTSRNLMPGLCNGIRLLKQDESRHIAYGLFLLSRLLAETPTLWQAIEDAMNEQVMLALGVVDDAFACYDVLPFGLQANDILQYAAGQFQHRIERLERSRDARRPLEHVDEEILAQ